MTTQTLTQPETETLGGYKVVKRDANENQHQVTIVAESLDPISEKLKEHEEFILVSCDDNITTHAHNNGTRYQVINDRVAYQVYDCTLRLIEDRYSPVDNSKSSIVINVFNEYHKKRQGVLRHLDEVLR